MEGGFAAIIACFTASVRPKWANPSETGIFGKAVKAMVHMANGTAVPFSMSRHRGSEMIIAIHRDPCAPIFGGADYGIVDEFQNAIPPLKEKAKWQRGG